MPANAEKIFPSLDQKTIQILIEKKLFLLDVMKKIIILTFDFYTAPNYEKIRLYDPAYLVESNTLERGRFFVYKQQQINFYNIQNMKIKKALYLQFQGIYPNHQDNDIYPLNCKSLSCFNFGKGILVQLNIINLKIIRKLYCQKNNYGEIKFSVIQEKYALNLLKNINKVRLHIIDLFNLNIEISDLDKDGSDKFQQITFHNEIPLQFNRKRITTQFGLTK